MVSPVNDAFPSHRPAPLAWKEFRRRSGFNTQPKVYVYDTSPQIVPNSPPISALNLSPLINNNPPVLGVESPRRENSSYFLSHVSQALQVLGASTGGNIAEYIANNFNNEIGVPYEKGRKLHYMVNAILSSPKYKYLFLKDQVLKDEKRSLWRLRNPEENTDEDTVPTDMSLSALIPPTSPCLSLKVSRDEVPVVPTPLSSSSSIVPTNNYNNNNYNNNNNNNNNNDNNNNNTNNNNNNNNTNNDKILTKENYGGGIDDDEKPASIPRTTEHPPLFSSSPISASPTSPDPCSPPLGDTPSLSLSSRRRKRKGLDSSTGIEDKPIEEQPAVEEQKKRRLDLAP